MSDPIPIEEVAEKTYRIQPAPPGIDIIFSTYIIACDEAVLVEPGPATAASQITSAMRRLGVKDLSWIIPTHLHMDHAGGTGILAEAFPRARVLAHPMATRHFVDPTRLIESTRFTYGEGFESLYGPILPIPESQLRPVRDAETIRLSDRELKVLHTPGHAPHHIAVFDRNTGCLFCGEALGMPTDIPLPAAAFPSFDLDDCLNTMEKLRDLEPKVLCYSHGGMACDAAERIAEAIRTTRTFGEMILASMKKGLSLSEISDEIRTRSAAFLPPHWENEMVRVWLTGMLHGYTVYFANKGLA